MRKKAFTLMEIIIVVVAVAILATIGFPLYQTLINDAYNKACEANELAIQAALDVYVMQHDRVPAVLSELPEESLKKAYASILERKDAWKIKLAYFIIGFHERGLAYASFLSEKIARGNLKIISCPVDSDSPARPDSVGGSHISYGLNTRLKGINYRQYEELKDSGLTVLGDYDDVEFVDFVNLAQRHKRRIFLLTRRIALGVHSDGFVQEIDRAQTHRPIRPRNLARAIERIEKKMAEIQDKMGRPNLSPAQISKLQSDYTNRASKLEDLMNFGKTDDYGGG